jgi:hypothetical protein
MDQHGLPHGAKGIEIENFAIEFRADKIVFVPKSGGAGNHYTIHAGQKSGIIDLHETHPDAEGRQHHRTLFAMRRADLAGMIGEAASLLPELLSLFRPLKVGWMKRHNIGIARGVDPVSDGDISVVTRKRKQRLTVDAELYQQNVFVPEFLDEVFDFPDGNFALFHRGRQIGIGFKKTYPGGDVRLFWIKLSDLMRFGNRWLEKLASTLVRLAIPPERYAEHPFLRS